MEDWSEIITGIAVALAAALIRWIEKRQARKK